MRIAIANGGICMSRGGSERAAIRLASEMRQRGHDVRLLTASGRFSPLYPVDPRIPIHFFPKSFLLGERASLEFGAPLLKELDTSILVSFESDWKHAFWGTCADRADIPFVCSERNTPYLIERRFWNREGRLHILEKSAAIHELLPCYLCHVPEQYRAKTFVIPNAAMADAPNECPVHASKAPVLLYLGRFSDEKRPWLLLRAFALLADEFPHWRLRFAGWGEKGPEIRELRKKTNLESRVAIEPANEDVGAEYSNADIYCLPTKYEGFPNTVLEAMGHGLPIVGISDCQAMASIVQPGINGFLAEEATPECLAAALRPLLASEKPRLRMGQNAWRESRELYGAQKIFDQWESELEKVIAASAKA